MNCPSADCCSLESYDRDSDTTVSPVPGTASDHKPIWDSRCVFGTRIRPLWPSGVLLVLVPRQRVFAQVSDRSTENDRVPPLCGKHQRLPFTTDERSAR